MPQPELIRHLFGDNVMATHFSLVIEAPTDEVDRVGAVADEYFDEIRRLESLLSRFVEDSDISRIKRLNVGESAVVAPETFRCLSVALEASRLTEGRFDVAYRSLRSRGQRAFALHTKPHRVQALLDNPDLDLGGIGKGFALDYASEILERYGYTRALLCAGTSTLLALDPPQESSGWAVTVQRGGKDETLSFARSAVSCSGKSVHGEHIFDVNEKRFATKISRGYVQVKTAALADAFSTAIMTMNDVERHHFKSEVISMWSTTDAAPIVENISPSAYIEVSP
jgi:thiamine biosynthesis lipoprotein ApbE